MSTPLPGSSGPPTPPNHILKAMARYRVSQSEEGVGAPVGSILSPEESSGRECEVRRSIRRSRDEEEDEERGDLYQGRPSQEAKVCTREGPAAPGTCLTFDLPLSGAQWRLRGWPWTWGMQDWKT